jgi:hypothetical protein
MQVLRKSPAGARRSWRSTASSLNRQRSATLRDRSLSSSVISSTRTARRWSNA